MISVKKVLGIRKKKSAKAYFPPKWKALKLENTYMACYIKNISNGVEIKLRKCY